jgi:predicted lipid-binding transport protein (Tim44 family)
VAGQTDVQRVSAQLLGVVEEDRQQIVSVRFEGLIAESVGAPAEAFDEVWHLVKPVDRESGWAIAGIQQLA